MTGFGPLGSLRGRVALVATLTVAGVLLLVGLIAVASFASREQDRIDDGLKARPAPDLARALGGGPGSPGPGDPGNPPGETGGGSGSLLGPPVLRPSGEYVRLISGGQVVRSVDVPADLPVPEEPGLVTLSADGSDYRSLTRQIGPDSLIEVGVNLDQADSRVAELRNRLLLIGLAGVLLVAVAGWWLAGLALRPLARLRDAAGQVSSTEDLSNRIDPGSSPVEIEELTASINAMLARLEGSAAATDEALEATRRFAGDAGHELRTPMTALQANLGTVRRNPDLDPDERTAVLEQMDRDATRMMRMLATLQTLARGDSASVLPREPVELTALVGGAVASAGARHPEITWSLDLPEGEVEAEGWPDGLRAMVDNLLENAARHGRPEGRVEISVSVAEQSIEVAVEDDGEGIPAERRERIFERFERGDATGSEGSGLGLSLVRQQARLHGGDVEVGESSSGGARFTVRLRSDLIDQQ